MHSIFMLCLLLFLPIPILADTPHLLFDQGHRQAFVIQKEGPLQLSQLARLFQQQGWEVEQSSGALTEQLLADIDALIISGAFSPLTSDEINAVLKYLRHGGRLAVMIHIGQPVLPFMHELGVDVGTRVINERPNRPDDKSIDFVVSNLMPHPLTKNLVSFAIYGGWPLRCFNKTGQTIASSSVHSWVDMNQDKKFSKVDIMSPFAVLVVGKLGLGSFAIFADDAIFQNQFLNGGNKTLAENLGHWLMSIPGLQVGIKPSIPQDQILLEPPYHDLRLSSIQLNRPLFQPPVGYPLSLSFQQGEDHAHSSN